MYADLFSTSKVSTSRSREVVFVKSSDLRKRLGKSRERLKLSQNIFEKFKDFGK